MRLTDYQVLATLADEGDRQVLLAVRGERFSPRQLPYVSPERTGKVAHAVGAPSDLYALGVILYRILCGRAPFVAASAAELISLHLAGQPMPPDEDDSTIEAFRSRFAEEIGDQGGVLTAAFPRLEALVGAQDPIEKLMGVEAENRFRFVFLRFVGLLATPEQPLLLFLDDLQWSDLVSLNIVKALALSRTPHLMLCLAYRDNEVDRQHPFQHALDELAAADLPIERIQVGDLSLADIASLIADTLRTPHSPLARMVHTKTHGNSFFVHQHARALQGGDRLRARDPDATRHPPLARAAARRARRRAGRGPCRSQRPISTPPWSSAGTWRTTRSWPTSSRPSSPSGRPGPNTARRTGSTSWS